MQIQGHYELKFEAVREAFAALFEDPQERGAALCIQIGGETVIDLWAGTADKDGAEAWHSDTIANLFSCTKTFTAVTALQLVAEGKLKLDAPVADYWPAFAASGKAAITLRQLLCHQAGLPALRELLPPEALYDWQTMVDALAAEQPWWTPGDGHGYAAITYGWLVGELIRRADGRGPGSRSWPGWPSLWGWIFMWGWLTRSFIGSRISPVARAMSAMPRPSACCK